MSMDPGEAPPNSSQPHNGTAPEFLQFSALEERSARPAEAVSPATPQRHRAEMPVQDIPLWTPWRALAAAARFVLLGRTGKERPVSWRDGDDMATAMRMARRRTVFLALVLLTSAAATLRLYDVVRVDDVTWVEGGLVALFSVLFTWISASFWMACLGALALRRGPAYRVLSEGLDRLDLDTPSASRTAVVMPIYNEDAVEVFARLRAVIESVGEAGALPGFDFYILSDSTDPVRGAAEEVEWHRLRAETCSSGAHVYYRRRPKNIGRKSGNIADFCENWGSLYAYMVILDADSLMTGRTLVRLTRLMDANPRAALIQSPPFLVGGSSLFSRIQQFSSSVYGPVYTAGLDYLQGGDGNYWGHNAIIRVEAFIRHCGLPALPGRPPLGGEILSHDFVEASLLRRAGWEVWLAPDLGGSYESVPPTLMEFLKRDRRWCQGNLQHIKLIFAQGFHIQSRLHLANGVMSYLSSPLWLLLLIFYGVEAFLLEPNTTVVGYIGRYPVLAWPVSHTVELITLVTAAAALLYGPKLLALCALMQYPEAVRAHGGRLRVTLGVIGESIFSTLFAPVMMLSHTWFVFSVLTGRGVGWLGQQRNARGITFSAAGWAFWPHTLIAVGAGIAVWQYTPEIFGWYVPLLLGPLFAILLYRVTSLPAYGLAARRGGLFLIPSEVVGIPIVDRADAIIAAREVESVNAAVSPATAQHEPVAAPVAGPVVAG